MMERSGLVLAEAEGRRRLDRFRRRIIFPIARENGSVVAFGGRALGDDVPKYLNSPETPIYSKSRVLFNLDPGALKQFAKRTKLYLWKATHGRHRGGGGRDSSTWWRRAVPALPQARCGCSRVTLAAWW